MDLIILILLLAHLISIVIMEIVIYSLPFEFNEDWKRAIIVGTPINVFFNFIAFCGMMKVIFKDGVIITVHNLLTLNCSYQDIARLASSCLLSVTISLVVSWAIYQYISRRYDTIEKFRFISPILLLCVLAFVPAMIGYQIARTGANYISISEVCRKTTTNIMAVDKYIEDSDSSFVVIRNDGELAFDADKLFLSDDEEELQYIEVNGGRVSAGDTYTCVIAGGNGMDIKKKGGTLIYLSNVEGTILDSVVVPALARDESYKKNNDGWEVVSLLGDKFKTFEVAAPVFSADSGFYENDFYLSLSADEGSTIYYTLDCTEPTVGSDCYSRPIHVYDKSREANKYRSIQNVRKEYKKYSEIGTEPVDKAFVVRAIAVDKEGHQSKTVTKTFWVDLEQYREKTVISLVTSPNNLFDEKTGIYVNGEEYEEWYEQALDENSILEEIAANAPIPNYQKTGEEWERPANCEIISNSKIVFNQSVGIRIQGASTRNNALKRFSVYSRKDYSGSKWFDSQIINDKRIHSFVLRGGFLNAFVPTLVEDRDVSIQHGKKVEVFLDGEYWYSVYLLEKYSDSYFSEYYQLHSNNVQLVKNETDSDLLDIVEAEYANDEEAYSRIDSAMDIQSYIDYICINAYLDNEDMYEGKNYINWKSIVKENEEYGDTRWRWLLYDMDLLWNFKSLREHSPDDISYKIDTFTLGNADGNKSMDFTIINQPLYKGLRKNSIFCRNFVLTFMDLVNTNFRAETVVQKLEEWENSDQEIADFFTNRADYIVPYMANEFELRGEQETVTLMSNRSGNPIILNTIQPQIHGEWSGKYFTDYPVTVVANDVGLDHWEITANGITKRYYDEKLEIPVAKGGVIINAIYQ